MVPFYSPRLHGLSLIRPCSVHSYHSNTIDPKLARLFKGHRGPGKCSRQEEVFYSPKAGYKRGATARAHVGAPSRPGARALPGF